jgi:hypothetical protein
MPAGLINQAPTKKLRIYPTRKFGKCRGLDKSSPYKNECGLDKSSPYKETADLSDPVQFGKCRGLDKSSPYKFKCRSE